MEALFKNKMPRESGLASIWLILKGRVTYGYTQTLHCGHHIVPHRLYSVNNIWFCTNYTLKHHMVPSETLQYGHHMVIHRLLHCQTPLFHTHFTMWTIYGSTQTIHWNTIWFLQRLYTSDTIWFYTDFTPSTPYSMSVSNWILMSCQPHRVTSGQMKWVLMSSDVRLKCT